MRARLQNGIFVFGILGIAAVFRFIGLDWDAGYMLHPDERFLIMVMTAMQIPESFLIYLDSAISMMNPALVGYEFFVYGTFPLILTKLAAVWTDNDSYNQLAVVGRVMAASADLITVFVVYKIGRLLERYEKLPRGTALFAMGAYAMAVLPIQLAHFFTVDPFLLLFTVTSLYFCLLAVYSGRGAWILLAAVWFGMALGAKVSAVYFAPVLGLLIYMASLPYARPSSDTTYTKSPRSETSLLKQPVGQRLKRVLSRWMSPQAIGRTLGWGVAFSVIAFFTVRIVSPHYFSGELAFPGISELWLQNIASLEGMNSPDVWFPPAIQWINTRPVVYGLWNTMIYGTGLFWFITMIAGMTLLLRNQWRKPVLMILLVWSVGFFLYQSVQFVKALRYFLLLYPLMALAVGYALASLAHSLRQKPVLRFSALVTIIISIAVWPLMLMNIYLHPHTRVEASYWIYQNLPDGSMILTEHWDDPLPLLVPNPQRKQFTGEQLEVFAMDSDAKFATISRQMAMADYYIMSSNRGWGSMPKAPKKYPRMGQFYDDLFAQRLGYEKVAEFTRYPSLEWMGIPLTIPDDTADETFTVYDHPKVLIYAKMEDGRDSDEFADPDPASPESTTPLPASPE